MSVRNGRTSCFPAGPSTHVRLLSGFMGKGARFLEHNLNLTLSPTWQPHQADRSLNLISSYSLWMERSRTIFCQSHPEATAPVHSQPKCDHRYHFHFCKLQSLATKGDPTLLRTPCRGWCYCRNATRARAFQSPDSGSN